MNNLEVKSNKDSGNASLNKSQSYKKISVATLNK